jgi:beta-1,4-N-acetylglucosaminyltransferase
MGKVVFITIGTTEFNELMAELDSAEFLAVLQGLGFTDIVLQFGRGSHVFRVLTPETCTDRFGMTIRSMAFTATIEEEIRSADLVIGHAGAGTVLEVVTAGRPFVCVVNETLQGNHQEELAKALRDDDVCVVTTVRRVLRDLRDLVPQRYNGCAPTPTFPIHHPDHFAAIVDSLFE